MRTTTLEPAIGPFANGGSGTGMRDVRGRRRWRHVTAVASVETRVALEGRAMSDPDLCELRKRAQQGDIDAVGQLVELAGERGDFVELRRLADEGSSDASDVLVELAGERRDRNELRRLASGGNQDAADVLAELDEESTDDGAD